jgi:hypothetical protein
MKNKSHSIVLLFVKKKGQLLPVFFNHLAQDT